MLNDSVSPPASLLPGRARACQQAETPRMGAIWSAARRGLRAAPDGRWAGAASLASRSAARSATIAGLTRRVPACVSRPSRGPSARAGPAMPTRPCQPRSAPLRGMPLSTTSTSRIPNCSTTARTIAAPAGRIAARAGRTPPVAAISPEAVVAEPVESVEVLQGGARRPPPFRPPPARGSSPCRRRARHRPGAGAA